jgi:L-ascorbate metabolism protein UlaG (beta-lactamase superfamily)
MGTICFLGHSTVLLEIDGVRILTDPVLVDRLGPLHRHNDAVAHLLDEIEVDVVLISHGHHDHLHAPSIRRLRGRPRIVVPRGLGKVVKGRDVAEVVAGDHFDVGALRIDAIRAEHDGGRRPFGPVAAALGYRIAGSSRVYFAGDTDLFAEMNDLAGTVDVALLPVWGWGPRLGSGHLDPRRAAKAVVLIRPRLAIPIHWGTFYPFALARLWAHPLGNPPQEFAREAARVAPLCEIRILAPGQVTELPSS